MVSTAESGSSVAGFAATAGFFAVVFSAVFAAVFAADGTASSGRAAAASRPRRRPAFLITIVAPSEVVQRSLTVRRRNAIAWINTSDRFLGLPNKPHATSKPVVRRTIPVYAAAMLSAEELERYARHIVLREVGGPGQAALGRARVLVVGAGGLGAPALLYLAAAGVGTLGVVDDDVVALSNLQRQVIHGTPEIGAPKTDSAASAIRRLNPHVTVEPYSFRLTAQNALDLISGYDIVADGSDNFATRYLVADTCYFAKKPLVTAALGAFDGTLTTIRAHERGADGKPNPSYRCLFPEPPPPGTVPACAEAGILGALAGIVGSMMALEVIREIVGFGESLVGRILMLDARAMRFETLRYSWDPDNPLSGEKPVIKDLSVHS